MERKRFVDWSFGHYLNIAHPHFVGQGGDDLTTGDGGAVRVAAGGGSR